jgi:hypothetical protein
MKIHHPYLCYQIRITASDLGGVHNAIVTLLQMFSLFGEEGLLPVVVTDRPACAVRAMLVDMNPFGRVPKIVSTLLHVGFSLFVIQ